MPAIAARPFIPSLSLSVIHRYWPCIRICDTVISATLPSTYQTLLKLKKTKDTEGLGTSQIKARFKKFTFSISGQTSAFNLRTVYDTEKTAFHLQLSIYGLFMTMQKEQHTQIGIKLPQLQNSTDLVRFGNHGVMYSRHRCFISMLEARKPWMHSSRNSRVRCGSLAASRSLTLLMKMVLLDGMHRPIKHLW